MQATEQQEPTIPQEATAPPGNGTPIWETPELVSTLAIVALIVVFAVAFAMVVVFRRAVWRWVWMVEEGSGPNGQSGTAAGVDRQDGSVTSPPSAYRLLVIAVLCVTGLFVFTMLLFVEVRGATNNFLFDDAAQVIAALSLVFTVIGTLVGTYFGVKQSGDARDTAERISQATVEASARSADTAVNAVLAAQGGAQAKDLILIVTHLHEAWNLHQRERVLGYFTDNPEVRLGPLPSGELRAYGGREEVGNFVQTYMPGSSAAARNHRIARDEVTWEATVTWQLAQASQQVRQMGIDAVENRVVIEGTATATFEATRIRSFSFTLPPATLSRIRKPDQPDGGETPGGGVTPGGGPGAERTTTEEPPEDDATSMAPQAVDVTAGSESPTARSLTPEEAERPRTTGTQEANLPDVGETSSPGAEGAPLPEEQERAGQAEAKQEDSEPAAGVGDALAGQEERPKREEGPSGGQAP